MWSSWSLEIKPSKLLSTQNNGMTDAKESGSTTLKR
jgi:hypothetical protein